MKNKILIAIGAILLLLAISNPSPKDYYYYRTHSIGPAKTYRLYNFVIFSIYTDKVRFVTHLGIAGNYFELP